ncbi:MAG: helix-turn-helix domain-containing protein [Hyphomicrobium sp.]
MKSKLLVFGKRLREARLRAGLSQVDVAKRIGKSKQLASAWELGRAEMTATTLGEFARIASTDANWLLFGTQSAKSSIDVPSLPQGCSLPFLTDTEAIKLARGKLELGSAPSRIYCSFPAGPRAFAILVADNAMTPRLGSGDVVVVDPDRPMPPGAIVAAVVKETDATLDRPILALRSIHYRSPVLGTAPYDLVPSAPAWPSLTIRKNGHAIMLGAVSTIVKR